MEPALYLAIAVGLAVALQILATVLKVPALLLLLIAGFGFGQVVTADVVLGRDILFAGITLSVGLILFEGAITLQARKVRDLGGPILRLCTVTVIVSWLLTSVLGVMLGLDPRVALLVGAILVVTGPTVINPILRTLRPTRRVSQLLRWEGIIVDPIGAILAVLVYQAVITIDDGRSIGVGLLSLAQSVGVATACALPIGWAITHVLRRHIVPDYLHGVVLLSVAIGSLVASNLVVKESGLLAVTMLGIYLANSDGIHLEPVTEFMEHLQVLFVGSLFIMLAGRVTPQQVVEVAPAAGWFVLALVLVIRPLSIQIGLFGTRTTRSERTLMMFMAPRGIVAAALTAVFAEEFHHAADAMLQRAEDLRTRDPEAAGRAAEFGVVLGRIATQVETVVPLVFLVIVATVGIYGLGVGRLAERLGLATTTPRGVVFSAAPPWVVATAKELGELDVPALVVARRGFDLARARNAGLRTEAADILSEYAMEEMDLSGIKSFIASGPDDDTNTIAAGAYARDLGRANTFQVTRRDHHDEDERSGRAGKLVPRTAFEPALTYEELDTKWRAGRTIATLQVTKDFTFADFRAANPQDVVLFVHRANDTGVAHGDMAAPAAGDVLIVMQ